MKPVFPTYLIKTHAKRVLSKQFFSIMAVSLLPELIITLAAIALILLVPGAKDSVGLILTGNFESARERVEYQTIVFNNILNTISAMSVLFAFLTVGAQRVCLDAVRGKKIKIRQVFQFYGKWYIAMVYPLCAFLLSVGIDYTAKFMGTAVNNTALISIISNVLIIAYYFVSVKLLFFNLALADNGCENVRKAFKNAWQLTGFNTVVNAAALGVSFIGWFIVTAFTGIALIYVMPYFAVSLAALYDANVQFHKAKHINNEELDEEEGF